MDDGSLPSTERVDPRLVELDAWPIAAALEAMWEGQLAAVALIKDALPAINAAVEAAIARLRAHPRGRLVYTGAGSSGRLGASDGAELGPTFDWPDERLLFLPAGGAGALTRAAENAEDDRDGARRAIDAHAIGAADVVIGIAASGNTPFTVGAVDAARGRGALTIGVGNSPNGALLASAAHAVLVATGAEAIAGSTRMKAGTAQKIVLNLLSTGIMLGLGRVYRGRMVEMRPRNDKLRRRAERTVAELAGVDAGRAAALLTAAAGSIKLAILLADGRSRPAAEAALARADGVLRVALAEAPDRP